MASGMENLFCFLTAMILQPLIHGSEYYDYKAGNINMIITAPHGGYDKDIGCLPRIDGCLVSSECIYDPSRMNPCPNKVCKANPRADTNTKILAEELVQIISDQGFNGLQRPHLITMKAHRVQIDANRGDLNEACMGCLTCLEAYQEYHGKIEEILDTISSGGGILFDIHGQAHGQNSTEFGYAIDKMMIDDAVHNTSADIEGYSTIQALAIRRQTGLKELLLGNQSMGAFLQNEGFDGLPSPSNPIPGQTNYKYYRVSAMKGFHSSSN